MHRERGAGVSWGVRATPLRHSGRQFVRRIGAAKTLAFSLHRERPTRMDGILRFFVDIGFPQEVVDTHVTPHDFSTEMQWREPPNPELLAKVELFRTNTRGEVPD